MISSLRKSLVLACVLVTASGAWAQEKIEPVLTHVPAGAMGFVVVHEAKALAGKVDKFVDELGLGQMLSQPDPADPNKVIRISVLDMLRGAAQLGPGFNPNGGVAAVMLDPNQFGVDLFKVLGMPGAGGDDESAAPAEKKLPFVLFVPGSGIKEVFGAYETEAAGKYTLVKLRMGPMYAAKLGGYILLSPMDKALDAVLAAKKKAVADLPDEQVVLLAKADLAYYVNMTVAGPVINKAFTMMEQQMVMSAGPMAPVLGMYMKVYRDLIDQLDDVTVGARFVDTGLVFEEMVSFKTGSMYGQAVTASKAGQGKLNALPDLPYALAVGAAGDTNAKYVQYEMDFVDSLLKSDMFKGMPEEEKARLRKLVQGLSEQVTGMQMVGGGAPAGNGLFGLSFVIQCKSADEVKALLGEKAKLIQGLIRHFGANDEDAQKFQVRYITGVETVGGVSADAIVVEHPNLDTLEEDKRIEMKKVLGEDKIRILVAAPDKNTVVVTFGGGRAFLAEALKVAAGTGKIGSDPATAQALKHLPKQPNFVMLLNGANLYQLIVAGMKTMEPNAELPPFKVTCKVPIALGGGVAGQSMHVAMYLPTDLIKEVVGIVMMFASPGAGAPPAGPDDF